MLWPRMNQAANTCAGLLAVCFRAGSGPAGGGRRGHGRRWVSLSQPPVYQWFSATCLPRAAARLSDRGLHGRQPGTFLTDSHPALVLGARYMDCPRTRWPQSPRIVMQRVPMSIKWP